MVSGKYSALSGAIARQQTIDQLSNNLANVNTAGFKQNRLSFESILTGEQQRTKAEGINYARIGQCDIDFTQGALKATENPLDLAIQGDAYFKLETPEGPLYTRRGDFGLLADGTLTTSHGLPVLGDDGGPIKIPEANISKIGFAEDGAIYIIQEGGQQEQVGKVGLFYIEDKNALEHRSDTTFALVGDDTKEKVATDVKLVQGAVETSNVNMIHAMANLIETQRAYDTLHKAIKSYSSLSEENEKLGRLS